MEKISKQKVFINMELREGSIKKKSGKVGAHIDVSLCMLSILQAYIHKAKNLILIGAIHP